MVDKDIAEQNYQKVKAQGASGSGVPPAGTKIDGLKDEMIQAENRMELCKVRLNFKSFHYEMFIRFLVFFCSCEWPYAVC